ncbi:hypothetical protein [Amycolatopsis stemonae]
MTEPRLRALAAELGVSILVDPTMTRFTRHVIGATMIDRLGPRRWCVTPYPCAGRPFAYFYRSRQAALVAAAGLDPVHRWPLSAAVHGITARYPLDYLTSEPDEFLIECIRDHESDLTNTRPIDGLTWAQAEERYVQELADVVAELAARAWTEAGR